VRTFKATLDNARLASERLPGTVREVQEMVAEVRNTTQEVKGAVADLRGFEAHSGPDIESAIKDIRHASDNLAKTSDLLEHFVADNEPVVSRFTQQSLPEFEQLLRESRQAARDFRDLSRSLKQNPSQLIYEPRYGGVEVAK
jgi:phospholipid/cholesterol/gamma-HCH transport system substrate-binding protein